ncbi:MAG: GtrA family protein [Alistipes sp.]|nr:GtrA family protein [Alistipes sp.]
MSIAQRITRLIDAVYVAPVNRIVSREFFRYAACGAANMALDALWYFVIYHFIVAERFIDLGFVTISPHIASLVVVFPITFFTGFWLNRNVAFVANRCKTQRQLMRYGLSVIGSIALNYGCMKLFVESLGIWPTPAKLLTTIVSVGYSFLAAKYYTFRK